MQMYGCKPSNERSTTIAGVINVNVQGVRVLFLMITKSKGIRKSDKHT